MGATSLSIDDFATAIKDVLAGAELKVSDQEAQTLVQEFFRKQEEKANAEMAEKGKKAKAEGEQYLADNAMKEGVVTLPSGLQYKVLSEGNGKKPKATDKVKCHYHGTLINGTVFDSSVERGQPAVFGVNQVIPGWVEALQLMPVGSKWRLFIPSHLAYGEHGAGEMIEPNSTLIFDVELLDIV